MYQVPVDRSIARIWGKGKKRWQGATCVHLSKHVTSANAMDDHFPINKETSTIIYLRIRRHHHHPPSKKWRVYGKTTRLRPVSLRPKTGAFTTTATRLYQPPPANEKGMFIYIYLLLMVSQVSYYTTMPTSAPTPTLPPPPSPPS